jgi:hypothetical protein
VVLDVMVIAVAPAALFFAYQRSPTEADAESTERAAPASA